MPEMDDLIASLRERIRSRNAFENNSEEKVYSDEKIIFTADRLRSFRPPELREMRRIAQSKDSIRWSESRLFYEQAKFMAEFEDDKPYDGSFELYFPTYQRLNEDQLRGYFTWRKAARKGQIDDSRTTYCFIYISEILHLRKKVPAFSTRYGAQRRNTRSGRGSESGQPTTAHITEYPQISLMP